jgi:hypothetical protein
MDVISPRAHRHGVEQRHRGFFMGSLPLVLNSGMTLLAVLLAVVFATLVCG